MASTTRTVLTPTITGAAITQSTEVGSSQTLTVAATTAQGCLDLSSLRIRIENQNTITGVSLSLGVGTDYSGIGIGAATVTIATATTVIFGGQGFESSRFVTSAETVVFTQTGTGPTVWEAYQNPRATE